MENWFNLGQISQRILKEWGFVGHQNYQIYYPIYLHLLLQMKQKIKLFLSSKLFFFFIYIYYILYFIKNYLNIN